MHFIPHANYINENKVLMEIATEDVQKRNDSSESETHMQIFFFIKT